MIAGVLNEERRSDCNIYLSYKKGPLCLGGPFPETGSRKLLIVMHLYSCRRLAVSIIALSSFGIEVLATFFHDGPPCEAAETEGPFYITPVTLVKPTINQQHPIISSMVTSTVPISPLRSTFSPNPTGTTSSSKSSTPSKPPLQSLLISAPPYITVVISFKLLALAAATAATPPPLDSPRRQVVVSQENRTTGGV